jgi:hypothetical protein
MDSLRKFAKIPVTPQKVERIVDQPVLPARRQLWLQFREVGTALMGDDHFAVDDGFTGDIERDGNHREPLGPVQPLRMKAAVFPMLMWPGYGSRRTSFHEAIGRRPAPWTSMLQAGV